MNARLQKLQRRSRGTPPRLALVSLYDVENNAVRLLAAILRREGWDAVEIYFKDWVSNHLEPATDLELDNVLRVLRRERIGLVCLSVRASAYFHVARILTDRIHASTDLPVLWGGMHPTLEPEPCLRHADLVLRGEADLALPDLVRTVIGGGVLEEVPNLGILVDGAPRLNPLRGLLQDLDSLPFRDYVSHDQKYVIQGRSYRTGDPMRRDPTFQMLASRGCIYHCAYCYNSTFKNQIYPGQRWFRTRSCASVLAELTQARTHRPYKRVRFDDEVFNFETTYFDEFCERYPREVGVPFEIFVEPKLVTRERMVRLKAAGLAAVYMGIQSSDRVTDHLYDRRVKNQTIEEIAQLLHEVGIKPHYQLIFDDPVSSEEDRRRLFDLVCSFPRPYDLYLFSMTVFPGSELNRKLMETGVISEFDVEGCNTRTFYQHRVNLEYPRPVEETFWISLIQLLSKDFVPRGLVRGLTGSTFLKHHPWPLIQFAHATNYVKLGLSASRMVVEGEMTGTLLRRWLSLNRVITT